MSKDKKTIEQQISEVSNLIRISDNDLNDAEQLAHFKIDDIPRNARILNVGSGYSQKMEQQLIETRPDVEIISVDPSLLIKGYKVDAGTSWEDNFRVTNQEQVASRIEGLSNKRKTAIALGQALPFADKTFDTGFDIYSAAKYARDIDSYKAYLKEIKRVVSGTFYMAEVFKGSPKPGDESSINSLVEDAKNVFNELGIIAELFTDIRGKSGDNNIIVIGAKLIL